MVCFYPLDAYRALSVGSPICFGRKPANGAYRSLQLACGQCVGCRLERSRQWAVRCMHEAKVHKSNCFITLTYADSFLPEHGSLVLKHFQDFMKRLKSHYRYRIGKDYAKGIRFFHCGEYGDLHNRPHYHACIFGHDFSDKKLHRITRNGDKLYTSEVLADLWPHGFSTVGEVTFKSAAYVARYVMKKKTGKQADYHYCEWDDDGVVTAERKPEYVTMSRRPGIGTDWLRRYSSDVYPDDFVLVNGKKARPPRFYDNAFEYECPEEFARIKIARVRNARKHRANNTPDRLKVREEVQLRKLERLHRKGVE